MKHMLSNNFSPYQMTIKKKISFDGIGVHTGKRSYIEILPADADTGIVFIKNGIEIKAVVENVINTTNSTTIGKNGDFVSTIEHLMAAFHGIGVDNAIVIVKGEEIPILDGSSKLFAKKMLKVGLDVFDSEKIIAKLTKPVKFAVEDRKIIGQPNEMLGVNYTIHYPSIELKKTWKYTHSPQEFKKIMCAKTFVVNQRDITSRNLGRGIIPNENAIILDKATLDDKVTESVVKHKVLDFLGDSYLLGGSLFAYISCYKGGHTLHIEFLRKILSEDAIRFINADEVRD